MKTNKNYWLTKKEEYPKTRRELLFYLWYGEELTSFNIFKEGSFYAITAGKMIFATHLKCIDNWSFEYWADTIKANLFQSAREYN